MKQVFRKLTVFLLVLAIILSMLPAVFAAVGTLKPNSGIRDQVCTALSAKAQAYYTGTYSYESLSALAGASDTTTSYNAMQNNPLYTALNKLMTVTHTNQNVKYDGYSSNSLATYWVQTDTENSASTYLYFYTDILANDSSVADLQMQREHIWPKSRASYYQKGGGSDLHHLRPAIGGVNGSKSSRAFANLNGTGTAYSVNGQPVIWIGAKDGISGGVLEVRDNVKGDVARILLYVYVRWQQPNLYSDVAADLLPEPDPDDNQNTGGRAIESLSTLLQWMQKDPVDDWEMGRNDQTENVQGNRNVFIDYPELAYLMFNWPIPKMQTPSGIAMGTDPTEPTTAPTEPTTGPTEPTTTPTVPTIAPTEPTSATTEPTEARGDEYALTTSLKDGDEVVIFNAASGMAMSEDAVSTNYRAGAPATVLNNCIYTDDSKLVWTVSATADGYTFKNDAGETLSAAKGLNFASTDNVWAINAAATANSVYLVSTTATGTSGDPKMVEWYGKYSEFSTYYYSSTLESDFALQLFVKTGNVAPTEVTEPTTAPTEPTTAPTEPTVAPTQPTVAPTEPTTAPTEPTTAPTEPVAEEGYYVADSLKIGDKIVFVATYNDKYYAMANDASSISNALAAKEVSVNGDQAIIGENDVVWTLVSGPAAGTYLLKNKDGKYINWTSSTSLRLSDTGVNFTPSLGQGTSSLTVTPTLSESTVRSLIFRDNGGQLQFRAYSNTNASQSGYSGVLTIYKYVKGTTPTEPTTAPTEPTTAPTEPTTAPTEPTTAPTEPTTAPTEPTTAPTEPTAAPTEPTTAPSNEFVLTTSLKDGDEVIIYNAGSGKAMSEDEVSVNYRAGADVTVSDNKIVTDDSKIIWTVNVSGDGYTFRNDAGETLSATKGLSYATTDNVWAINAAKTANSVYIVSTTATGTSGDPKYVEWYDRYTEFSTYYYSEANEGIFAMQLFVKGGSVTPTEPTTAPTEPTTAPTEPTVAPTQPTVAPTEPTEPIEVPDGIFVLSSSIKDGDQVVIYSPGHGLAIKDENDNDWYLIPESVTPADGKISYPADSIVWTVVDNGDGTFSFVNGSDAIVCWVNGNYFELTNDRNHAGADGRWKVSWTDGLAYVQHATFANSYGPAYLECYYNAKTDATNFSAYASADPTVKPTDFGLQFYVGKAAVAPTEPTTAPTEPTVAPTEPTTAPTEPIETVGIESFTLADSVAVGDRIVFVATYKDNYYAMSSDSSINNALGAEQIDVANDAVEAGVTRAAASVNVVWEVAAGETAGSYTLKSCAGKYIKWPGSGTTLTLDDSGTDFTISCGKESSAILMAKDQNRGMLFRDNAGQYQFRAYALSNASNTGYSNALTIYKLSGGVTPTEPTTAPTEPTTAPTEPTTAPTEPTVAPTEPTTAPTEPTTAPTEPTTAPTEPTTAPAGNEYVLTTSLKDGDEVVIYNAGAGKAMSEDAVSANYRAGVDVTVSGDKIVTDNSKIVWKVTASGDGFIFTSDAGETLSATKGLSFAATDNVWAINAAKTADSVYLVSTTAVGTSGDPKYVEWYDKYTEFSTYYYSEASEGIFAMQLFVKSSSVTPTEPTTAPTEPTTAPTEPTVAPTEPTTAPTEPTVAPTEPTVAPTEPTTAPGGLPFETGDCVVIYNSASGLIIGYEEDTDMDESTGDYTYWNITTESVDVSGDTLKADFENAGTFYVVVNDDGTVYFIDQYDYDQSEDPENPDIYFISAEKPDTFYTAYEDYAAFEVIPVEGGYLLKNVSDDSYYAVDGSVIAAKDLVEGDPSFIFQFALWEGDTEGDNTIVCTLLGVTVPTTEPTVAPTEPTTAPTEPTTAPTEPTVAPTEPTVAPTEPTVAPTEPTAAPTEPTTAPTEPTVVPTEPTTAPTQPTVAPTEPTAAPTEPTTAPTEPTAEPTMPTTPTIPTPAETFTITWYVDGKVYREPCEKGEMPVFSGSTDKPDDEEYTYTFEGWFPALVPAVADATYTAKYTREPIHPQGTYLVTWDVAGEQTTLRYEAGMVPTFQGSTDRPDDENYVYCFTGWSPAVTKVTENVVYTAQYKKIPLLDLEDFVDVPKTMWCYDEVNRAAQLGLFNGVSYLHFEPNGDVSRAMVVTVLYRMEGEPTVDVRRSFSDVPADRWYSDAILWAYENGIAKGTSETTFDPNDPVTREQLAAFMYRYAQWKDYDVSARESLGGFVDRGYASDYAENALSWAVANDMLRGMEVNGKLCLAPQGTATRAQTASIMVRFFNAFVK